MHRIAAVAVVVLLSASLFAQTSADADQVWSQEQAYWKYVQANNLEGYRSLWHADFLGWPSVSPEPLRKAHITDWITTQTSKGETYKLDNLERLVVQVNGNYATTTYRVRGAWLDRTGKGDATTVRIIHTWLHGQDGKWQIISGMSAPTNAEGH
jgi:ketosteroid isomerase-like protein